MSSKAKEKKIIDPEELQRLKFKALCRFRAIGRLAIANLNWLKEDLDVDIEINVDDVEKLLSKAVKDISQKKQLLSFYDKTLLSKPLSWRTDDEAHYLYRIIGGLKCFKQYPMFVKRKLVAATYFNYFGPDRVLIREGQEAMGMYYLVSGELRVASQSFDVLSNKRIDVEIGIYKPGDEFGHKSLMHGIPRMVTCTTLTHCELLCIKKADYKQVLQTTIQSHWDEIKHSMMRFTYFADLDKIALQEGCMLAKMISYNENEVILGNGTGVPNFVYFVLSGKCSMIECMAMTSVTHLQNTFYKLYKPKEDECNDAASKKDDKKQLRPHSYERYEKFIEITSDEKLLGDSSVDDSTTIVNSNSDNNNKTFEAAKQLPVNFKNLPKNVKLYFMQVCLIREGGCFGLGETMLNRQIIAVESVTCMLLPKYWLMKINKANIWGRIKQYLEIMIPSTQKIFEEFKLNRKWIAYKNSIVRNIVKDKKAVNLTTIHDVPYSVRIQEDFDFNQK